MTYTVKCGGGLFFGLRSWKDAVELARDLVRDWRWVDYAEIVRERG